MRDLRVVFLGVLVDGQEPLLGVEGEVAGVVIGEVVGAVAVGDNEELDEGEERARVAVAGDDLVLDDLLHRTAGIDAESFQLDLHARHAVDEQKDIVTVMAIVGVDAELADDLEGVLAPLFDVDQRKVERRAVVAGETIHATEGLRGGVDVGGNDLIKEAGEFSVCEGDPVEFLKVLTEVRLQSGAVADVIANCICQPF